MVRADVVVAYFKVQSQHFHGGTHENPEANLAIFRAETRTLHPMGAMRVVIRRIFVYMLRIRKGLKSFLKGLIITSHRPDSTLSSDGVKVKPSVSSN
jgi:hypothetical protein